MERRWTGEKGKAANGTALPLMNCCLTLLEGSLVRRNTNIIWSTTISSSLVQKRTEQFREIDNLHLRMMHEGLSLSGAGAPVEASKIIGTPSIDIKEKGT